MSNDENPLNPPAGDRLRHLLQRAERGDPGALPAVRLFLDEHPEVWREAGDLGVQAQRAWAGLAAGPNLLVSESVRRRFEEVRAAATGPAPTPLEGLLAERVALTWLAASYFDVILAQHRGRGLTAAQEDHLQRLQERAQRQHLQAVKALATIRKLVPGGAGPPPRSGGGPEPRPIPAGQAADKAAQRANRAARNRLRAAGGVGRR